MTDEEEFAARSQLKRTRDRDAWILLYRRRRMGRVVPDKDHSGMWRSVKVDGIPPAPARSVRSNDLMACSTIASERGVVGTHFAGSSLLVTAWLTSTLSEITLCARMNSSCLAQTTGSCHPSPCA
jgi:hypothetical protein